MGRRTRQAKRRRAAPEAVLGRLWRVHLPRVARAIAWGAGVGLAAGALGLLVGLGRAGLALLAGRDVRLPAPGDLRLMGWYLAAFGAAGALAGAARLPDRAPPATVGGFAVCGAVAMNVVAAAHVGVAAWQAGPWPALATLLGALFGVAFAVGYLRRA